MCRGLHLQGVAAAEARGRREAEQEWRARVEKAVEEQTGALKQRLDQVAREAQEQRSALEVRALRDGRRRDRRAQEERRVVFTTWRTFQLLTTFPTRWLQAESAKRLEELERVKAAAEKRLQAVAQGMSKELQDRETVIDELTSQLKGENMRKLLSDACAGHEGERGCLTCACIRREPLCVCSAWWCSVAPLCWYPGPSAVDCRMPSSRQLADFAPPLFCLDESLLSQTQVDSSMPSAGMTDAAEEVRKEAMALKEGSTRLAKQVAEAREEAEKARAEVRGGELWCT